MKKTSIIEKSCICCQNGYVDNLNHKLMCRHGEICINDIEKEVYGTCEKFIGVDSMTFKELREQSGMNKKQFSEYFRIPYRTVQNWELGIRECPSYLLDLMKYKLDNEI